MREKLSRRRLLALTAGALGTSAVAASVATDETVQAERAVNSDRWLRIHEDDVVAAIRADGLATQQGSARAETPAAARTDEAAVDTATGTTDVPLRREERTIMAGTRYETPVHEVAAGMPGPTTLVVGGMHGDEPSGRRAAEHVAGWGVERGRLVVLPAANVPALERDARRGPHGDLNRQFPATPNREPTSPPARAIWAFVREVDPDRLVDLHSSVGIYRPGDEEGSGVGQAIFPTDVPPAPADAGRVVEAANREFGLALSLAYRRGNLLDGDRPMLAHRAGAVLDVPGFIVETYRRVSLDRQVDWHTFAVESLMREAGQPPVRDGAGGS